MHSSFWKHEVLLYVFVSILFGTSNSISLNLMLPKLKYLMFSPMIINDYGTLRDYWINQESVAIGGFRNFTE